MYQTYLLRALKGEMREKKKNIPIPLRANLIRVGCLLPQRWLQITAVTTVSLCLPLASSKTGSPLCGRGGGGGALAFYSL